MKRVLVALAVCMVQLPAVAKAAEILVLSGGATKDVLLTLVPQFEKATGHRVNVQHVLVSALRQRILAGESADVLLMPNSVLDNLAEMRKILPEGRASYGILRLVAIVRNGAPRPDISTVDTFRRALVAAPSIVYSTPASTSSGAHMASMVSQLGIADIVERKAIYRPALEGGVSMVVDGRAAIGIYPASEVVHVAGITSLGPLPEPLQLTLVYGGAIAATSSAPGPAGELIRFLGAPQNHAVWRHEGFEIPH
jgi:molybdate transport system substrate-binding protein